MGTLIICAWPIATPTLTTVKEVATTHWHLMAISIPLTGFILLETLGIMGLKLHHLEMVLI
jgi:hypothetical protein